MNRPEFRRLAGFFPVAWGLAATLSGTPADASVAVPFDEDPGFFRLVAERSAGSLRITDAPGRWRAGGAAAELSWDAGEKFFFGTDRLNAPPHPGFLARLFGDGDAPPPGDRVAVPDLAGVSFDVRTERSTALVLFAAEADGSRYLYPFDVPADTWRRIELDFALFQRSEDTRDENDRLDGAEVHAIELTDFESIVGRDGAANRMWIDSVVLEDAATRAARARARPPWPLVPEGPLELDAELGRLVSHPGAPLRVRRGGLEVRFRDWETGAERAVVEVPRAATSLPAPDVPGYYRVELRRAGGAPGADDERSSSVLAVVPVVAPSPWLGTCVLATNLASVDGPGADPWLARATGVGWDRPIVSWDRIEPDRGERDWSRLDAIVEERTAAGIRLAPALGHVPRWASGSSNRDAPPEDLAAWESFAHDLVARYRGRVDHWMVGNEPNLRAKRTEPEVYARALAAFARGARRADPDVRLLLAGLAYQDEAYLEALYGAGAGAHFDVVNLHPYAFPAAPEVPGGSRLSTLIGGAPATFESVRTLDGLLARHGDAGKPVWITELSWGSDRWAADLPRPAVPFQNDAREQARYLVRSALLARAWGVAKWFWLGLPDLPDDIAAQHARSGVLTADGVPKPALVALAVLAWQAGDATAARPLADLPEGVRGVVLDTPRGAVEALWTDDDREAQVERPSGAAPIDLLGAAVATTDSGEGRVLVPVGPSPVYLRRGA